MKKINSSLDIDGFSFKKYSFPTISSYSLSYLHFLLFFPYNYTQSRNSLYIYIYIFYFTHKENCINTRGLLHHYRTRDPYFHPPFPSRHGVALMKGVNSTTIFQRCRCFKPHDLMHARPIWVGLSRVSSTTVI